MRHRWFGRVAVCGLIAGAYLFTALAGQANAWWDSKWQYRKKVVLNTTTEGADIREAITDLPVLLRLDAGNFTFGNAKPDGSDIRLVASDDKTPLKYHVERYSAKEEMALIWVKAPRVPAASNQEFVWLYYGNSGAATGEDSGGTYDTPQLAVYHLGEKEGAPHDATAYGNHAKEFTGKLDIAAAIGRGVTMGGQGDKLVIAKSPSMNISKGFTFSAWVRSARAQQDARLLSWDDGKQSVVIGIDGAKLYCVFTDAKKKTATEKTVDIPAQKWAHVGVSAEPGKNLAVYVNGQEKTSQKLSGGLVEPVADIGIGATVQGKNGFAGDIDEIEIAGIARSAAYIRAEALSQGPETPLLSYLDEETSSGGGSQNLTVHLLVVTAKAITLDGWLIIGAIIIMVGITWILFFNKFSGLKRLNKENAAFADAFSQSTSVLALRESDTEYEGSSLFRVYKAGMAELERRFGRTDKTDTVCLPQQAFTAFKGVLAKASLQESKRNTSGLILFTLSISGGPFMGLFGTVWGVINTFAGVAEAGEANLAAIAPGVASALACTLMGLVLAIPALFQYSFLSQDIKNMSADMNVFMEEFTTRVEEEYGGKT
ncbi:MAG TPA: MotA/TolQ/ExbB proton channel family protein [Syntrophorhabdaceae bacterium]|nr:MotA/TolQ/ExbB proton channel family protein [Syntrophorhabdaceae bacterium]